MQCLLTGTHKILIGISLMCTGTYGSWVIQYKIVRHIFSYFYFKRHKGFKYYIKCIPMFHHVGKKLHLSLLEITDTPLNSDFGLTGNEY